MTISGVFQVLMLSCIPLIFVFAYYEEPRKCNYAFVNEKAVGSEYACKLGVLYLYWMEYEVVLDRNNNTVLCTNKIMSRDEYESLLSS